MRRIRHLALAPALLGAATHTALGGVLFDPTLGTLPASQGWQYIPNPNNGPVAQGLAGDAVILDTTADRLDRAGYFSRLPTIPPLPPFPQHPGIPTLDRNVGFTLTFDLAVISEAHNARDDNGDGLDDRAGFSVIIVCQDLAAIEIGFFEDRVWAYDDDGDAPIELFTQAEGVTFDTTAPARLSLTIQGSTYTLRAESVEILAGDLRSYTSATGTAGLVYKTAGMVFLGDDTGSADSSVALGTIRIDSPPVAYCPGDINGDGQTNASDFTLLAANFGNAVSPGRSGDLNADGGVTAPDFAILAGNFGCIASE